MDIPNMQKLKAIFINKWVYIPLIILVLIGAGIAVKASINRVDYITVVASRGDFVQVISATGKVIPAQDVDLSFESGGRVGRVNVKVGDSVKRGTTLATLGGGDAYASLLGAQARLELEQIKLRDLQAGNRPEEVQLKERALSNSKIAKAQAEDTLKNSIIDAYIASDDLMKNDIDPLFRRNGSTADIIPFVDSDLKRSLDQSKRSIDHMLENWADSIHILETSDFSEKYLTEALSNLSILRTFLNSVNIAASQFIPFPGLTQSTIDQYKAGVSTSRSSVNSSISAINMDKDLLETAELDIKTAEDNLALSNAGANPFDIQAQRAIVKSAQASVLQAQAEVSRNVISAPFDGIVTKVNITVGQSASISEPSISLISVANFEIESFVPEADIAKIHLNDNAKVTLDAYSSETFFDAVITEIEPAETVIESVSTYRTIFQFIKQDERIKSGMTANIDIQGQVRNNILSVPQSAVLYDDDNKKTVYILKDGKKKPEVRSVRTGQTDDKGNIEIIDGITEGEKVVVNPPR